MDKPPSTIMASTMLDGSQHILMSEINNLRCKLDSKSKALTILSQDLLDTKHERDEFKLMAEQLRDRYSVLKRRVESAGPGYPPSSAGSLAASGALTQVLCDLTEQNKRLIYEVDDLKMKLIDAEGDLKLLREQMHALKVRAFRDHRAGRSTDSDGYDMSINGASGGMSDQRMDEVVGQLELFRSRVEMMERDLQCVLDEKEDLVLSRDAYKAKVERLNKRLNELTRAQSDLGNRNQHRLLDIDSILTENRFLQERLQQVEEEKSMAQGTLAKYKNLIEKANGKKNILNSIGFSRRSDESAKGSGAESSPTEPSPPLDPVLSSNVLTSKQVQQFIATNNLNTLEVSQQTIGQLRGLVIALFEAYQDKSSALGLQRKNNRLLGKRIGELEDKVRELQAKEKVMLLMKEDSFYPDLTLAIGGDISRPSDIEDEGTVESDSENRPTSDFDSSVSSLAEKR